MRSKVAIRPASYGTCREVVEELFSLFDLDVRGKYVMVKPNVLRPSEPEEAVTTHPAILRAVLEVLRDGGAASIVVGDNHGGAGGYNRAAFQVSGLLEASGEYYINIGAEPVEVPFSSRYAKKVIVSRPVLECDVLISLPKFKTAASTGMSCAIKNSYGILPGAQKGRFHVITGDAPGLAELLVDVFAIRKPDFVLVDGVLGMEGNGPASKTLRYIGQLIASRDAVAVDAVVGHMMGVKEEMLRMVRIAESRGLGAGRLSEIELDGNANPLENFLLPPVFLASFEAGSRSNFRPTRSLPIADAKICTRCGICVNECPANALEMKEVPEVIESMCVTCCCCQELCPTGAMEVRRMTAPSS
jgi:uncharacterized protein (DUF362 family)/Pyruvate/2-oxoacid:ferredoxin oxidoreductase delta subunit